MRVQLSVILKLKQENDLATSIGKIVQGLLLQDEEFREKAGNLTPEFMKAVVLENPKLVESFAKEMLAASQRKIKIEGDAPASGCF